MADDLSTQARDLVERYRRSVHAMTGEHSREVAEALAHALRAIERARTRETMSDDETAEMAVRAVQRALDSAGDPF
jgi:3-oxoacyl-[acyl-carrier-protein] synthase III